MNNQNQLRAILQTGEIFLGFAYFALNITFFIAVFRGLWPVAIFSMAISALVTQIRLSYYFVPLASALPIIGEAAENAPKEKTEDQRRIIRDLQKKDTLLVCVSVMCAIFGLIFVFRTNWELAALFWLWASVLLTMREATHISRRRASQLFADINTKE